MGELRERRPQGLILQGMASRTQEAYLAAVQGIAKYYHQRPDPLSEAQLQADIRFLLDERHLAASSVRVALMGIRVFYTQTRRRPWPNIPLPKRTKTLPEVLRREEVARLLASTTTVRQRALLMTTYGGGLRVREVVRRQVSDIDAGCGRLRVKQGKGRKDRSTLLGPRLVAELRRDWQLYRPTAPWLFPKQTKPEPMPIETGQRMYYAAKERAGITKAGGIHPCAMHLPPTYLEGGADLPTRHRLLGHESVTPTMHYGHLAQHQLTAPGSPLEHLPDVAAAREPMLPLSSPPTAPTALAHPSPPPVEVADIVRTYGAALRATHAVSHEQARVLRAIAQCRTAALGGHVEHYVSCGTERVCYDSCRNRHCPKCQGNARAKWLAAAQALLLPIPYFHVVFTLPHPLNPLLRVNQRLLYDLLFQTAAPCPLCAGTHWRRITRLLPQRGLPP